MSVLLIKCRLLQDVELIWDWQAGKPDLKVHVTTNILRAGYLQSGFYCMHDHVKISIGTSNDMPIRKSQ